MAQFATTPIPAQKCTKYAAVAASASTAELLLGKNTMFMVNATQDINITFGLTGLAAAAATDFRIPANQNVTFDLGDKYEAIRIRNNGGSAADIYVQPLAK